MTTYMYATSLIASGKIQDLVAGDNIFVAAGVTRGSTTTYGFDAIGGSHDVLIRGSVVTQNYGMKIGDDATDPGQRVTIASGGEVMSFESAGVRVLGSGSLVNNAGHISGHSYGLEMYGISNSTTSTVNNSGVIESDGMALSHYLSSATEKLVVNNSGTIKGGTYSFNGFGSDAVEVFNNTGKMIGAIRLDGGNDVYDGHAGHHTSGVIDGGAGNDTIKGGAEADNIVGGAGIDLLSGGGAKDVFWFKTVNQSGHTAATRDIVTDFVHGTDKINLTSIDPVPGGGNEAFVFDAAKGTAGSAVTTGHVAWYQENNAGTANDHTIIMMNTDGDAAIESMIQLNGLVNLTAGDFVL